MKHHWFNSTPFLSLTFVFFYSDQNKLRHETFRIVLIRGILVRSCQHTLSRQIMRNGEPSTTNTGKSNNHRMFQQLDSHKQQTIQTTRVQDLDNRPCEDNAHESVLTHEMTVIDPSENRSTYEHNTLR